MSERRIPAVWGMGWGFLGTGPLPTFWPFMVGLRAVMALVGESFSMLMCFNEQIMKLKVYWIVDYSAILDLVGSNQLMLCPQWLSFF